MVRLLTVLLPGRIYITLGPLHCGDFRNIFLPNIGEDQKKSCDFSVGPLPGTAPYYGRSGPDYCITFIKRLDVDLRLQLFRQKLSISSVVVRLNWLVKIESRGARGPWSFILLLVTVVSEKR